MCVPKGEVCGGNLLAANWSSCLPYRNGNTGIGQGRTSNLREVVQLHDEAFVDRVKIGDFVKSLSLSALGTLAITRMHQGQVMRLARDRCRDAGVHPAAQQDHRLGSPTHGVK